MKKLMLGLATAALVATAAPAMAQVGVFAGRGGVGVQLGAPNYYGAPYGGYYDYYNGPAPGIAVWPGHPGWRGHARFHRGHR